MIPVLFRDARFAVLDKPAGMPVHPVRGGGVASVEDHFAMLGRFRAGPWLAHRLDRDTSGCLLVALRRRALHEAQAAFSEGRARKTYWAVVRGTPEAPAGTRRSRLRRVEQGRAWRMAEGEAGEDAVTRWRLRGAGHGLAWLELHPETGRTHQIRVHCAALGWPILGDPVYGAEPGSGAAPLHLHARALALPLAGAPLEASAPAPAHMRAALAACGFRPGLDDASELSGEDRPRGP